MSADTSQLEFTRPAPQIKAVNIEPVPERIFHDMKKYEDSIRGYTSMSFEREVKSPTTGATIRPSIFVRHRPEDAQVAQIYRMPSDTQATDLEKLTHFDIGSGRNITSFVPVLGDDWRGVWRGGGAIMVMDLDGSEKFQIWRYWEDSLSEEVIKPVEGELNNRPGVGRIERVTHEDNFRHDKVVISDTNDFLVYGSNKENNKDSLIYMAKLKNSNTGARNDSQPFHLQSTLIAGRLPSIKTTTRWFIEGISPDGKYVLITLWHSSAYRPLYVVDLSSSEPSAPSQIILPGSTEKEEETFLVRPQFSRLAGESNILYVGTNSYGDFTSLVSYDISTKQVLHITTQEPNLQAIKPIPWNVQNILIGKTLLYFKVNVEGWSRFYVMPLTGKHKHTVIEVKLGWETGFFTLLPNVKNEKETELIFDLSSYKCSSRVARADVADALKDIKMDEAGNAYINVDLVDYRQATPVATGFATHPPKLIRYQSFDGLEVPALYYHPTAGKTVVPAVINIHGGPESQATTRYRIPIHDYILNEMGCAIIYPNVRGSSGYGKRYMAADDVEKREDSVKDIGSLLDHIAADMKTELDASHLAVMGGSYGGYMVYACLVHFSSRFACGLANFGIAHWPSYLENTADLRRDHRRREYGDESNPAIRKFLESISPLNHASKITSPLSIAHGETDTRVPVGEALKIFELVSKNVPCELMVCEKEGHGFKQKSVIEFTNAAKIRFLEKYLLSS